MIRLICILALLLVAARGEDPPPDGTVRRSVERDGMTLSVELRKDAAAGGPYFVSIGLTSGRAQEVAYRQEGRHRMFDITLVDSKGEAVPFTRFGQRVLARSELGLRGKIHRIKPGRRHGSYLNLARLFDLSETGTYRLTVGKAVFRRIRDLGEPIRVKIEDIPLTIRHPKEADREHWRSAPRAKK